jgi:hypothetical protein
VRSRRELNDAKVADTTHLPTSVLQFSGCQNQALEPLLPSRLPVSWIFTRFVASNSEYNQVANV